jgi:hypothetical protein
MPEQACQHPVVLVDYDHPHGTLAAVPVAQLHRCSAATSRLIMTLRRARCGTCGAELSRRLLRQRIRCGGDLYDERFVWA